MRASSVIATAFAAGLTLAGAFSAAAQNAQVLIKQVGDWYLYCDDGDAKPKAHCNLRQVNVAMDDQSKFIKVMIRPEDQGALSVAFYVPATQALIKREALPVAFDNVGLDFGLNRCGARECIFDFDFSSPFKELFLNATIIAADIDLNDEGLRISTAGLNAAVRELNAAAAPPPP